MMTRWLGLVNRLLGTLVLAILAVGALLWFLPLRAPAQMGDEAVLDSIATSRIEPLSIGGPLLSLHYEPPSVRLPDLSHELVYYGLNRRPDADSSLAHLALQGGQEPCSVPLDQPLYLLYDHGSYRIQGTKPATSLWITPRVHESKPERLIIEVGMRSQEGEPVEQPEMHRSFELAKAGFQRNRRERWKLGNYRADNSILARMRTRWYGPDQLIELHGKSALHRLDFGDEGERYSCFVEPGGVLYWNGARWSEPSEETETRLYPILYFKEADEKVAHIEVWNLDGKGEIAVNLIRQKENWSPERVASQLKLAGARSFSRFVLESDGKRIEVSPNDWLLFKEGEWQKVATVDEIEEVVSGDVRGELLIIEEVERSEGRTLLRAHLFSPRRGEVATLALPLACGGGQ